MATFMGRSGSGAVVLIAAALVACVPVSPRPALLRTASTDTGAPVTFYCEHGEINANFRAGTAVLALSDGRSLTLPQAASGSGIRYEAVTRNGGDELFQSEGSWAQLSVDGSLFSGNCIAAHISRTDSGHRRFGDFAQTFSFIYPEAFSLVAPGPGYIRDWMANATSPGRVLAKVELPGTAMPGTNFAGADFTVGTSSDPAAVAACLTPNSADQTRNAAKAVIGGVAFERFTSSEGAAGNFYDVTSYRIVRANACYSIEYTIHSTNIGAYTPGTVRPFDEAMITATLDAIAKTFRFT